MRFVYYHPTSIPEEALQVGDTALVVVGRAKRQSCHVSSKTGDETRSRDFEHAIGRLKEKRLQEQST
jgi:hypothetical protein